jgi:hypothetical protein
VLRTKELSTFDFCILVTAVALLKSIGAITRPFF